MRIDVLNNGFVELVDHMGCDKRVEQAARVSYAGTRDELRSVEQTEGIIRYMMRNHHTSPFEHVHFTFAIKAPIFVWRQWIRHRTANVNEISGRYAQLPTEFYVPDPSRMQVQSKSNHQGSGEDTVENPDLMIAAMRNEGMDLFSSYQERLDSGLAKELARINLPLSTYTEAYWTMDLHNLFGFLRLRMHSHAQMEIQVYANAIAELIKPIVPMSYSAFEDFVLESETMSSGEMQLLAIIARSNPRILDIVEQSSLSAREKREFLSKIAKVNG